MQLLYLLPWFYYTSSITSARMVRPMNEIAEAARSFGRGDFSVRIHGYEQRRDETGALAEAFNTMADSISQSEQRRNEFIANVSHELKTPMTTIAGYTDGILDGTIPPEKERHYLQIISDESRRLSRLVRRILDVSQIQSPAPGRWLEKELSFRRLKIPVNQLEEKGHNRIAGSPGKIQTRLVC